VHFASSISNCTRNLIQRAFNYFSALKLLHNLFCAFYSRIPTDALAEHLKLVLHHIQNNSTPQPHLQNLWHGMELSKSTRRDKNDKKWEAHKSEIYHLYIEENSTLPETMSIIEERYDLKTRQVFSSSSSSRHPLFPDMHSPAFESGKTKSKTSGDSKATSPPRICRFSLQRQKNGEGRREKKRFSGMLERKLTLSG
jgi:hypothetical protein